MKKNTLEDYELFYMELPQTNDLIDIEIQDEYEASDSTDRQGLSEEQVADLARDSLGFDHSDTANPSSKSDTDKS